MTVLFKVGGSEGPAGGGLVQVVVLSTGHTVRGGTAPTPAPVSALAFNTHGTTIWAGDEKVAYVPCNLV